MHNLATELIKATGLTLKNPDQFKVTHVNCSHSDDTNPNPEMKPGDWINSESVVIKVVLEKQTKKV